LIFDKTKNQLPDQQYAVGGRDTYAKLLSWFFLWFYYL